MVQGVYLTLLVGPMVPVPAPRAVLDALVSVEVTTNDVGPSAFQLTFTLNNRSELHTLFLIAGGALTGLMRVIVIVTVNGMPQVLMDGIVTNQQVTRDAATGHSTLVITGEDLSVAMSRQEFTGLPYPAMPAEARVAFIVAKYAFLGIVPIVIPSIFVDVPLPTNRIPTHVGTDREYLQQLAREAGHVFYIETAPAPGLNFAYWGPQIKLGVPQKALNGDLDGDRNVLNLAFTYDAESKTIPVVFIQNEATKAPIPVPIPDITPLNPPLGLIPPLPLNITFLDYTAKLSPLKAVLAGIAVASRSADAVTGSGSLDVVRYGSVLRARQLVGVRGAGAAFDGLYYVNSVTSSLERGAFKQSFRLSRNGLLSSVPKVVP